MISPGKLFLLGLAGIVALSCGALVVERHNLNNATVVVATVVNKERLCTTETSTDDDGNTTTDTTCHNYVHTDKETFLNDNSVLLPHKDSLRVQGLLVQGTTYQFKVYGQTGWGQYRNIAHVYGKDDVVPMGGAFGGGGTNFGWR